jgi:hypothetical protein
MAGAVVMNLLSGPLLFKVRGAGPFLGGTVARGCRRQRLSVAQLLSGWQLAAERAAAIGPARYDHALPSVVSLQAAVVAAGEARAAASPVLPVELPYRGGRKESGAEGGKMRRSSSAGVAGAGRLLTHLPTIPILEQLGPSERPSTTRV